ncbi:MAG TPA: SET domain-containing protein [Microthrixaceae bacterium]|nr:SET domain-containing protein [Microthrixaceae bacterium]HNI34141.1 SET domain-containing protein [Microthrixaceae bacterium]
MHHSWLSPHVEVRPAGAKGLGLFATAPFAAGDIVSAFGGHVMAVDEFEKLPEHRQTHSLQIAEDLFMVAPDVGEPADFFNHSCDPNLGVLGNVVLVALRPVATDEELTFDYAMTDADSYDEFDCACLADDCRGKVTGYDWMIPEVQQRYRGHFSTYLERRIAGLASDEPSESLL